MVHSSRSDAFIPHARLATLPFAIATLLGAFLVFQVQPIISKCVLPWFGGTPSVWTTCMLFFQLVLFAGYLYAHLIRTFLTISQQAYLHTSLLVVACLTLPIEPSIDWKPDSASSPVFQLLCLLAVHVGLPYFVLSSTGPLVQSWLSTQAPANNVYRLYALSNAGSLAALLSYPFLFEPMLSVSSQSFLWSCLFICFVVVQCIVVIKTSGRKTTATETTFESTLELTDSLCWNRVGSWIGLSALASTILLTTTNHVSQDIAVIPFLWIVPLSLYLISFIIAFDSPKLYHPKLYAAFAIGALAVMHMSAKVPPAPRLIIDAVASIAFMFVVCVLCHGEVARLKPSVKHLTKFYVYLSAGGALGGLFVALFCPSILNDHYEEPVVMTIGASLASVLFFAARNWTGQIYNWRAVGLVRVAAVALPLISIGAATQISTPNRIKTERNFFGVLRVENHSGNRTLVHGTTIHGLQRKAPHQAQPTTYYGMHSGVAKLLTAKGDNKAIKVCGVGLGCGVLATYGRNGDRFDFIEINPAVVRVATEHFSFLSESAAQIQSHLGDGRSVLEGMQSQRFDLIVLDAFSSDSIPAHLLTVEAFQLYQKRITEHGMLAVHVSNKHLDIAPLVHRLAGHCGWTSKLLVSSGSVEQCTLPALWVLIGSRDNPTWSHEQLRFASVPKESELARAPLWTDQHHNLVSVLRTH